MGLHTLIVTPEDRWIEHNWLTSFRVCRNVAVPNIAMDHHWLDIVAVGLQWPK